MFKFLAKSVHEPVDLQRQEVMKYPKDFAAKIVDGEDCDYVPGKTGAFGSLTNPIPVNGAIGEIKYLGKLRGKTGNALFFHRLYSKHSPVTDDSVDVYECVCLDGTQWNVLHFDMYHPRRSNRAPSGYSLIPFNRSLGMDLPFGFGVNSFIGSFPHELPSAIRRLYHEQGEVLARRARARLSKATFTRPEDLRAE